MIFDKFFIWGWYPLFIWNPEYSPQPRNLRPKTITLEGNFAQFAKDKTGCRSVKECTKYGILWRVGQNRLHGALRLREPLQGSKFQEENRQNENVIFSNFHICYKKVLVLTVLILTILVLTFQTFAVVLFKIILNLVITILFSEHFVGFDLVKDAHLASYVKRLSIARLPLKSFLYNFFCENFFLWKSTVKKICVSMCWSKIIHKPIFFKEKFSGKNRPFNHYCHLITFAI